MASKADDRDEQRLASANGIRMDDREKWID
jgi:hypothetical protein